MSAEDALRQLISETIDAAFEELAETVESIFQADERLQR